MPLVAKRKLTETWRQAVARRAAEFGKEGECVEAFDAFKALGRSDVEAAFATLSERSALSLVPDGLSRLSPRDSFGESGSGRTA